MDQQRWLTERFEENRPRLRGVAYRMLGSLSESEDAVQEAWLRLNGVDAATIENLSGWLTTVVSRVCLDMLRGRKLRREEPIDAHVTEPRVLRGEGADPEGEAVLADSVGVALLVVLDTLTPAERLAFVLHDLFAMPFDEIGRIIGRTTTAAKQLASRARRRVRGAAVRSDGSRRRQREVVDAFLKAGVAISLAISVVSLSMIGFGVFAGANTPNHEVASSFGRPASAEVGTCGRDDTRDLPVTASARSLPEAMCCMKGGGVPKVMSTWPPNRSCSAGPVPLYGTCVSLMPACCSSMAPVTCCSEPLPDDA